jgi:hypothetical protein
MTGGQGMKQNNRLWSALALYAMLAAALLFIALLGAQLYQSVTASQQHNEKMRATLAYVQSRVAAADAENGVSLAEGPEGQALILKTSETKFEVRIYCYAGNLVEETAIAGNAFAPDKAQKIAACDSFSLAMPKSNLLSITADGCEALASLRTGEGEAA